MKKPAAEALTEKLATGIDGFDEISRGGLPRGRTTLVMGGPGGGKTVFALQALVSGAVRSKRAGIFVAFEEGAVHVVSNAAAFGWDLPSLTKKKLFFLDARLSPDVVQSGGFDLMGMLTLLKAKADEIHAATVVFDGIDVLLDALDDDAVASREMYRLRDWLEAEGLTSILTLKVDGNDTNRRYNFLQFMADCVVVLRHRVEDGASFRNLRVMKYRGSDFLADEFPISFTPEGMRLTSRGPIELAYPVSGSRVSSGLERLDKMLSGGYHRGSHIVVSGAPGTAKTTLGALFAAAACDRGERTMFVSFDEGAKQIVRNLRSVNVQLAPHVESGLLTMYSTRTRGPNIDEQFADLRRRVAECGPRCLVIDPISALSAKLGHLASADAARQFLDFLKREGITAVTTSLERGDSTDGEEATGIAGLADTWIHLSYVLQDGERNRALTIVKSRGTRHSNQVRELTLADEGVSLADAFVAQGRVLMGVARWEWEQEEKARRKRLQIVAEHKRLELTLGQAEAAARLQVIKTEMDARAAEMEVLADATGSAWTLQKTDQAMIRKLRHADSEKAEGRGAAGKPRGTAETTNTRRKPSKAKHAKGKTKESK